MRHPAGVWGTEGEVREWKMILAHCPSPSPTPSSCQHPSLTDLLGPRSEAEAADFLLPGTVSSPPGPDPQVGGGVPGAWVFLWHSGPPCPHPQDRGCEPSPPPPYGNWPVTKQAYLLLLL